jgi:hypothetical protein
MSKFQQRKGAGYEARGKREAQRCASPLVTKNHARSRPEGPTKRTTKLRPFTGWVRLDCLFPGARAPLRFALPWLSYPALWRCGYTSRAVRAPVLLLLFLFPATVAAIPISEYQNNLKRAMSMLEGLNELLKMNLITTITPG